MLKIMTVSRFLKILFIVVSIVSVFNVAYQNQSLVLYSKSLIFISLLLWYRASLQKPNALFSVVLLLFCFGELVLVYNVEYVTQSLVLFLLGVLLLIYLYFKALESLDTTAFLLSLLPYAIFIFTVFFLLVEYLGDMLIPVVIYSLTLTLLGMITYMNYLEKRNSAYQHIFLGAFLFLASNSFVCVNVFVEKKVIYELIVVLCDIFSLYLFTAGMILKDENRLKPT